jgi:hypothetical protein
VIVQFRLPTPLCLVRSVKGREEEGGMGAGWHTDSSTRAKYVGTTLIVEARVTKTPLLGRGGQPAVSLHTQSRCWP